MDAKGQRGGEPIWCAVDELLSHLAAPAVLAAEVSTKRIASRFAPLPSPRRPRPVALALDRTCTLTPTEVKSGDEHREASRAELQRDEQRRLAIGTLVAEAKKPKVAFDDAAGGLDDKEVLSLAALDAQIDKAAPLVGSRKPPRRRPRGNTSAPTQPRPAPAAATVEVSQTPPQPAGSDHMRGDVGIVTEAVADTPAAADAVSPPTLIAAEPLLAAAEMEARIDDHPRPASAEAEGAIAVAAAGWTQSGTHASWHPRFQKGVVPPAPPDQACAQRPGSR